MERWTPLSSCRPVAQNRSPASSLCKIFFFAFYLFTYLFLLGFLCGSDGKESAYNAGDLGSIPWSGGSLEKGMATHSIILAWRIPWTEEPGGLQSMGSQRVGHN